jgi:glycosidase
MKISSFDPPKDFIFGGLDKSKNAAKWLKERYHGVRHYNRKNPINPKPGDKVRLEVTCSVDLPVETINLWMTTDDWQHQEEYVFEKAAPIWKTEIWSYLRFWEIMLPEQPPGTMLRYKIAAKLQGSVKLIYADKQTDGFKTATQYSIWYSDHQPPNWIENAITYQIFVDRFHSGKDKPWVESNDLREFFGGSLDGVREKLPYIKEMGFNTIWLTPIFESPTHQGYDISNYYEIHPNFGTKEGFIKLLDDAHSQGIKVILDFVANHCSNEHPFFVDALKNRHSDYHDFFVWKDWPQYESFYDVKSMPKLNLAYGSPAREYLLECAQYWLELGVDGFRLDYAHGPEQDFWVDFRRICETVQPDAWTFGEVVQPADVQVGFAGGLMGALDFLLCQALRLTFAQKQWPLSKFVGFLQAHYAYFPKNFTLPSFLDNHDMNRFIVAANQNKNLLKLALLMIYLLPGPPIIYYGTEIPVTQKCSVHGKNSQGFDEARLPMDWENESIPCLHQYIAKLAEIREKYLKIWQSDWVVYSIDDIDETAILKKPFSNEFFLLINRSSLEKQFIIDDELDQRFYNLINHTIYDVVKGQLKLLLPPQTAVLLKNQKSIC